MRMLRYLRENLPTFFSIKPKAPHFLAL